MIKSIIQSVMLPGRGAVWLAHQYGVLGVGGSNPLVPTRFILIECQIQ